MGSLVVYGLSNLLSLVEVHCHSEYGVHPSCTGGSACSHRREWLAQCPIAGIDVEKKQAPGVHAVHPGISAKLVTGRANKDKALQCCVSCYCDTVHGNLYSTSQRQYWSSSTIDALYLDSSCSRSARCFRRMLSQPAVWRSMDSAALLVASTRRPAHRLLCY